MLVRTVLEDAHRKICNRRAQTIMQPHRIHLRGPWEYEWLSRESKLSDVGDDGQDQSGRAVGHDGIQERGRVKLPADWQTLFGLVSGQVRFRRRFGHPTNLDWDERVFLVFEGVGDAARVSLGQRLLGVILRDQQAARFEVTSFLQPRNELIVDVEFDAEDDPHRPGGLWKPVALEIHNGTPQHHAHVAPGSNDP